MACDPDVIVRCASCGTYYKPSHLVEQKEVIPSCCLAEVVEQMAVLATILARQKLLAMRDAQRAIVDPIADAAATSNNPELRKAAVRYRNERYKAP